MTERLHFHFSLSCIVEGNGNPLQCSCLENPRDGGAWWAAVYGVAQSWTRLKRLSSSSYDNQKGMMVIFQTSTSLGDSLMTLIRLTKTPHQANKSAFRISTGLSTLSSNPTTAATAFLQSTHFLTLQGDCIKSFAPASKTKYNFQNLPPSQQIISLQLHRETRSHQRGTLLSNMQHIYICSPLLFNFQ